MLSTDHCYRALLSRWADLNRDAEAVGRHIGERNQSDWAHSTAPELAPYRKRLGDLQAAQRKIEATFGIDK